MPSDDSASFASAIARARFAGAVVVFCLLQTCGAESGNPLQDLVDDCLCRCVVPVTRQELDILERGDWIVRCLTGIDFICALKRTACSLRCLPLPASRL